METILKLVHRLCALVAFVVTLVLVDLPLKILSVLFVLIIGILGAIFYPLTKKLVFPRFFGTIYDYASDGGELFAKRVWNLWMED